MMSVKRLFTTIKKENVFFQIQRMFVSYLFGGQRVSLFIAAEGVLCRYAARKLMVYKKQLLLSKLFFMFISQWLIEKW